MRSHRVVDQGVAVLVLKVYIESRLHLIYASLHQLISESSKSIRLVSGAGEKGMLE